MEAKIVLEDWEGRHNLHDSAKRVAEEGLYKDSSMICIVPTRGMISAKVTQNWMGMFTPMNQKFTRMFMIGMEVGQAYNRCIEAILANEELSKWKFIVTLEEDNLPPPDGFCKIATAMHNNPQYSAIGGIYWTKGDGGQPMIYGDPKVVPKNCIPQVPIPNTVQECNGLGMGFTCFRLDIFKTLPKPWFVTKQEWRVNEGSSSFTQDLYFFTEAQKHGHRFACDTSIKVGHYSYAEDIVW